MDRFNEMFPNNDYFESFEQLIKAMHEEPKGDWRGNASSISNDKRFTGTNNYSEALKLVEDGWPEGVMQLSRLVEQVEAVSAIGRCKTLDLQPAGAFPLVPLFCSGETDYMINFGNQDFSQKPIVRIGIDNVYSAFTPQEQVMAYGAGMVGYIDELENSGVSCELTSIALFEADDNDYCAEMTIKRAGEPLDIDRLAFMIAHPSSLRRVNFRMLERHPKCYKSHNGFYGRPGDIGIGKTHPYYDLFFRRCQTYKLSEKDPRKVAGTIRYAAEEARLLRELFASGRINDDINCVDVNLYRRTGNLNTGRLQYEPPSWPQILD